MISIFIMFFFLLFHLIWIGGCVWGYTSLVHWVVRYSWTTSGCSFLPTQTKIRKLPPQNKRNTARRRRRRDNNLTNQLFFQLWSGLVIQKPWGCTRGCDAQALAQALKNATVSYFCLYAVVPWVVRSPEIQLLSNLVLTNVSHFCLCWGLYEGCAGFFLIVFFFS